uniref:Uncharacterized protein n=1 Tax=Arundo donax TaxID=35708 RepID=A0A0A9HAF5_ARUDO
MLVLTSWLLEFLIHIFLALLCCYAPKILGYLRHVSPHIPEIIA